MPIRWDAPRTALASIAEAVGRTPLVRLNRVTAAVKPEVLLKIEWYGPSGSLKDRIYLHMFERAEARGDLKPGMRVLECSRSEEHTSELQSQSNLVCRLLLEKKNTGRQFKRIPGAHAGYNSDPMEVLA